MAFLDIARSIFADYGDGRTATIPAGTPHFALLRDGSSEAGIDPAAIDDYAAPPPNADDVRAEAGRRILSRFAGWQQRNMTARGVELLLIGPANWGTAEQQEAAALQAAWDWIKSVRAASDAMEAAPPADYRNDTHWPDAP